MSFSKPLNVLLREIGVDTDFDVLVTDICIDSREVTPGSLFIAYPGTNNDGRDFIAAAIEQGAIAVVYESIMYDGVDSLPVPSVAVPGLMRKVGLLASAFFDHPTEQLQVFGVTGTNGKTTCAYLLAQSFKVMGMRSAFIGTIGVGLIEDIQPATHTTPDPIALQKRFAEFVAAGVTQVSMEVSSHALHQGRVAGVNFYAVLFTNLTQDHLDYHSSMEDYGAAKAKLFTEFDSKLAVINADDEFGQTLIESNISEFCVTYGQSGGDVVAEDLELATNGIAFTVCSESLDFDIRAPLIGSVNVPNLLLVAATLLALSTPVEEIQNVFSKLNAAPGRMELFAREGLPRLVVDYAHTPDALSKALASINHHCTGDLWCVFGCGGDRDRGKRALMGAATEIAQHVIITNDNPRSEDPAAIASQIRSGVPSDKPVIIELDRERAVQFAMAQAKAQDWILLAGKGHETTQTIGAEVVLFSDRELATRLTREGVSND